MHHILPNLVHLFFASYLSISSYPYGHDTIIANTKDKTRGALVGSRISKNMQFLKAQKLSLYHSRAEPGIG
jgi:hypothetical protein